VFFSLNGLHPFWQALSRFNPVLYLINGVRYGVLGITDVDIPSAAIISIIFLVIFHILGYHSLKKGDYQRW
jgi:ABC-2 type transport system permease protein